MTADVLGVWRAAQVRRWHAHPDWRLRESGDDTAAHSGRACALAAALFPDRPRVCQWLALHDLGESTEGGGPGDLPATAKRHSDLCRAAAQREAAALEQMGLGLPRLDERERDMAWLCDRLDAWLWCAARAPDLLIRFDWQGDRAQIERLATETGVGRAVRMALQAAERAAERPSQGRPLVVEG